MIGEVAIKKILLAAAAFGLLTGPALTASADTATANMSVSATAVASCTVAAENLAFLTYNATSAVTASATITVTCGAVSPASASVSFGAGENSSGEQRQMASGESRLKYDLFSDSQHASALASSTALSVTLNLSETAYAGTATVYGRIPAAQNVVAGSYTDTVVVTLTY